MQGVSEAEREEARERRDLGGGTCQEEELEEMPHLQNVCGKN